MVKTPSATAQKSRYTKWRPLLPNIQGIKYLFYQKVSRDTLEREYETYLNDATEDKPNFIKYSNGPFYTNLVLYVLEERVIQESKKPKPDYRSIPMTQSAIMERITKLFSKYGYTCTQSSIAKALQTLETPFCYGGPDNTVYVVMSKKLEHVKSRGERFVYWLDEFRNEYEKKADLLKSVFKSKVALPYSYIINEYYLRGNKNCWIPTGFAYRFKKAEDANDFKESLLHSFGEQCFFNVIVYEENVIILLAQEHPSLRVLSELLSNVFLS